MGAARLGVLGRRGRLVHGVQCCVLHHLAEPGLLSDLELETNAAPRLIGLDGRVVAGGRGPVLIGVQGRGSIPRGGQVGGRPSQGHGRQSTIPAMPDHKLGGQMQRPGYVSVTGWRPAQISLPPCGSRWGRRGRPGTRGRAAGTVGRGGDLAVRVQHGAFMFVQMLQETGLLAGLQGRGLLQL